MTRLSFAVILILVDLGVLGVYGDVVVLASLTEGDLVTLHTAVIKQQPTHIKWYFNDIRIAQLDGYVSDMCTDVQCNDGTERFRDRLKMDHETGSLTIINITNKDSGFYHLLVSGNVEKIFNVTVHDDHVADQNELKENEGESVTLNPGVRREPNDMLTWYFNDILIAKISVNESQICTNVRCKERFTDRLKLDNKTASLTITNIRSTDSGNYTLEISIRSDGHFSITREKTFSLTVISLSRSHLSGGAIAGIVVLVVVAAAAAAVAGVIYYLRHRSGAAAQDEGVADDPSNIPLRDMGDS